MKPVITTLTTLLLAASLALAAVAEEGSRKPAAVVDPPPPDPIAPRDPQTREPRHPGQPPTVPHSVRDMQVDLNANQCLHCHAPPGMATPPLRPSAPNISASHYQLDKGRNVLDGRRYFCSQCHVPQYHAEPLFEAGFTNDGED